MALKIRTGENVYSKTAFILTNLQKFLLCHAIVNHRILPADTQYFLNAEVDFKNDSKKDAWLSF